MCFAREEEGWILQSESNDFHLVSFCLQLAREALVEGGETTAEGICCAEYDYFHVVSLCEVMSLREVVRLWRV